jgi:dihydroflavonol-4-reductase
VSNNENVLITGASGFLGLHLTRHLLDTTNAQIHTLSRSASDHLSALDGEFGGNRITQHQGSVLDADAVKAAVEQADSVYHLAGSVSRDKNASTSVYRVHIDGTRTVLQAVADAGKDRVLVLSTSGTNGVGEDADFLADEDSPIAWDIIKAWPYYESKAFAEKEIAKFVAKGLPVKVARPTLLLGPGDYNGSSTGDVVKFLCGDVKAALPGGMSAVDTRDVAAVLPAILEKGEAGVGYLLGAQNCTVREFLTQLSQVSGVAAPAMSIPRVAVDKAGSMLKWLSSKRAFGGLKAQTFEMGCYYWYIDSSRASEELGFSPRPMNVTLRVTVEWLR